MAYFICDRQDRCCPHEFYDSIEQAITDSEDGVPCDHLIEVEQVRHGRWLIPTKIGHRSFDIPHCSVCNGIPCGVDENTKYCPNCGAKMDLEG